VRPPEQVLVLAHADPRLLRLFQRHLDGYRITAVPTFAEAMTRALELRAAAVIADLEAEPDLASCIVPVLRCPLLGVGQLADHLGVADYLVKPVSRDVLLAAIQNLRCPIKTILVVDDDAPFAWLVTRMLSSPDCDYRVATAHSGEEALARVRANPPDLLLLDLSMPGVDGTEILQAIRADATTRKVRVIVISARGEGEGELPLGQEARVVKPEGLCMGELTRWIDATVRSLRPIRGFASATGSVQREAPTGSVV
jgi:CheY-like chemotaxis protein